MVTIGQKMANGRLLFQALPYKAKKPFVCLSAFWHADNSAVSASMETGLAQCESCAFDDHRVYFYKPKEPTVHHQRCIEDEDINHGQ